MKRRFEFQCTALAMVPLTLVENWNRLRGIENGMGTISFTDCNDVSMGRLCNCCFCSSSRPRPRALPRALPASILLRFTAPPPKEIISQSWMSQLENYQHEKLNRAQNINYQICLESTMPISDVKMMIGEIWSRVYLAALNANNCMPLFTNIRLNTKSENSCQPIV